MRIQVWKTCLAVLLAVAIAGTAQANLITNGDFESGLTGWTTSGDVVLGNVTSGPFSATHGMVGSYALLGNTSAEGNSSLSQRFTVSGLGSIDLTFDWVFRFDDASTNGTDNFLSLINENTENTLNITWSQLLSSSTGTKQNQDSGTNQGTFAMNIDLTPYTLLGAPYLTFLLQEAFDNSPHINNSLAGIDNVMVTGNIAPAPVPEPATLLLVGSGLVGLAAAKRRKKSC